jgi:aromatic-L-amino-acid decarboxylase
MTLLERLNDGGEVFLTHTTVGGSAVLRVASGSPTTTRAHVERVWTLLCEAHDWLAADFAAAAAERAAAADAERAAAERAAAERARAEAEAAEAAIAVEAPEQSEAPESGGEATEDVAEAPEEAISPSTTG